MSDSATREVENLIRAAGVCPQLSTGLRERVIVGAVRTRGRVERRLCRDHLVAACGVLLWVGMFFWQQTVFSAGLSRQSVFERQMVAMAELSRFSFSGKAPSGVVGASEDTGQPEWALVEVEGRMRVLRGKFLRRCLQG